MLSNFGYLLLTLFVILIVFALIVGFVLGKIISALSRVSATTRNTGVRPGTQSIRRSSRHRVFGNSDFMQGAAAGMLYSESSHTPSAGATQSEPTSASANSYGGSGAADYAAGTPFAGDSSSYRHSGISNSPSSPDSSLGSSSDSGSSSSSGGGSCSSDSSS